MRLHNAFVASLLSISILLLVLTTFNLSSVAVEAQTHSSAALQQSTPTPPAQDGSEIGSTDGILIMGVVIVLIVTLPLILYKRK
jgi:hypothetical protein